MILDISAVVHFLLRATLRSMIADKPKYTQVMASIRTTQLSSFLKVLAYYRTRARENITNEVAITQNKSNMVVGFKKRWINFECSFIILESTAQVAVAM